MALATLSADSAGAAPGYELDPVKPSIALGAEIAHGVAIDQASQAIYVTELTTNFNSFGHGQIEQFTSSGVPTANSPFVTGGDDFFTGVAVNPVTQGIYAYQAQLATPFGVKGTSQMDTFSSLGVAGPSFSPTKSTAPQIATDASGRVFFPNDSTGTVQVFDSTGALKESIACSGCPGGAFSQLASAALDSAGNLYVVDRGSGGRAIKFTPSGGSFAYDSVLQSGEGAVALGVDPASGDVFVGDLDGATFHVVAYDSTGTRFDDFGGGTLGGPPFGAETAGQIAANSTTHKVYVADPSADKLWIFDRVASILAPTASTTPASLVGQVKATLNGSVNPNGHGLSDCHFEYTTDADFQTNVFANATSVPCLTKPYGAASTPVLARLTNLPPATSYDFRIVAATNGGSVEGAPKAFETLPPLAPSATTGSASAITMTSAKVGGTVNAHGGTMSSCHLEYTDEAHFQEKGFSGAGSLGCAPSPEGTTDISVSAQINSLAPGTSYRFRIVATNNSGTVEASDKSFATLPGTTCATNAALCPLPVTETPAGVLSPAPVTPAPTTTKPIKCRKGFKKKRVHGKSKCVKVKKKHSSRRPS